MAQFTAREITTHKVNGLNDALTISVLDAAGLGGACHEYEIKVWQGDANVHYVHFQFQKGPIAERGVNGVSNEALLAVVADRLRGFQAGEFATEDNAAALMYVKAAIFSLHQRTLERLARRVEGTSEK